MRECLAARDDLLRGTVREVEVGGWREAKGVAATRCTPASGGVGLSLTLGMHGRQAAGRRSNLRAPWSAWNGGS